MILRCGDCLATSLLNRLAASRWRYAELCRELDARNPENWEVYRMAKADMEVVERRAIRAGVGVCRNR